MAQAEFLPFAGIVDYLRQLCAQERSGTVFLVSDDNRMAQVRLDKGQIASLLCRNRRGLEALGILRSMGYARLRFDESFLARGENDQLSNQAVFDGLAGAAIVAAPAAAARPAAPPAVASVAAPAAAAAAVAVAGAARAPALLTPRARAVIQRVLTQYIGPMAEIVCDDHCDGAADLPELLRLLAGEISAPAQAAKFSADIARELGL